MEKTLHSFLRLLLLILLQPLLSSSEKCDQHLHSLASRQKDFVQCSTLNSVPVSLCIGCIPEYTEMIDSFSVLKNDTNCTKKYFDNDKINIVSTTESILVGLWEKAYCNNCFNSNNSGVFEEKSVVLEECIQDNPKTKCTNCLFQYISLNNFYKELYKNDDGKVCYDIQDSMNRTRSKWSDEFKCCTREFNPMLFLVAISLVGLLPVLFYGGTYALTIHRERNHDILDADPELDAEPTADTSTTAIIAPHTRSPQQQQPPKEAKLPNAETTDDSDDESDQEIIRKNR